MIRSKGVYEAYKAKLKAEYADLAVKLQAERQMYDKNLERFHAMEDYINACVINFTVKTLLEIRSPVAVNNIQIKRRGEFPYSLDDLRSVISLHINMRVVVIKLQRAYKATKLLHDKLTYKIFLFITREANEMLMDEIIKGHTLHMGYNLASILVVHKRRVVPPVDWDASNKLKQAIIDRGGKPYHKDRCPDGEKWLLRHNTSHANYFRWIKKNVKIGNSPIYKFQPNSSTYTQGAIKRLHNYNKQNPLNYLNYTKVGE